MKFDLARQAATKRPSRRPITLPPIISTQAQADTLAAIYLRVVNGWRAGAPRIIESYEHTLVEMVTDSVDGTASIIDDIAAVMQRLVLVLTPNLRDFAYSLERWHRGKFIRGVLAGAEIDLTTILSPLDVTDTVEASIKWNVSLIKDVSEESRRRISNAVFSGLQNRTPAAEIAKQIRESAAMSRRRSIAIASDQTTKLGARLNQARQQQAGLDKFKWRHSSKRHPREWHRARDGKIFPWEGSGIAPNDMPSVPPWCGCTAQGVITFDDE